MTAHADSEEVRPARIRLSLPAVARSIVIAAAVAWLVAGGVGAYLYVHRYWLYRGFPPPVTPAGVATGTPVRVSFFSRALGRRASYLVYLPAGYDRAVRAGRRFPAMYILHGHPGHAANVLQVGAAGRDLDVLMDRHRVRPMLLVIPEGRRADTEWANASAGPWESFVLDVVHDVDHRFATIANRRDRLLAGLSEGAYGALNVTLHNLAVFGNVQVWSGYFVQTGPQAFVGASPALLAANSPADYVPRLAPEIHRLGLNAFLYGGLADRRSSKLLPFVAELRATGAHVQWGMYPGAHDWALWRRQLPHMLEVANSWFHPSRTAHGARRARRRGAHRRARPRPAPIAAPAGTPLRVYFFSRSLRRPESYLVYLPAGYRRAARARRRFPVMYILHGHPGDAAKVLQVGAAGHDLDALLSRHRVRPMLLVMPEGANVDTEWANATAGPWEGFVLDVVRDVDHRFATLADRRHRVIAGLSEGAYGALNVALHHLAVFGNVQVWSGYFVQTGPQAFVGASRGLLAANSPADYVLGLAPTIHRLGLNAFLYGGLSDRRSLKLLPFVDELKAAGASVRWALYPGLHNWSLWRLQLPHMLEVANRWFGPAPAPAAGAHRRHHHGSRR
jgi:enterochelin esterase-like enzyme